VAAAAAFLTKKAEGIFRTRRYAIQLKYARDNGKKRRAIETLVCFGNEKFIY
jgi:hypothetical protein